MRYFRNILNILEEFLTKNSTSKAVFILAKEPDKFALLIPFKKHTSRNTCLCYREIFSHKNCDFLSRLVVEGLLCLRQQQSYHLKFAIQLNQLVHEQ
jgi:hypothetical protein